ncbi:MAG: transporter [Candidatus Rokubacteria bacterium]|nr:transporter [Candidatus Rokubacteria bacterium]
MSRMKGIAVVGLIIMGLSAALPALARGEEEKAEEVSLPSTFVTEGATPATEVEGTFTMSKSRTERAYGFGFSSLQYAPVPSFGVKLAIPFAVRDPRDTEPTVAGFGDVSLMAKYAPLMLPKQQFALGGGLKLTFPTGSERRELGGTFAIAPFLAAGKGFGPFSLQADLFYSWQLNRGATIRAEEEGAESIRPEKEQGVTGNLTATYSPVERLGVILELNSVTVVKGEDPLKERVQLYLTPGVSVEPAKGWNLRGGIQLPVTSAKEFDYNLIIILTKGF